LVSKEAAPAAIEADLNNEYEKFLIIVFNGNLKVSGGLKCFVMQGEYDF